MFEVGIGRARYPTMGTDELIICYDYDNMVHFEEIWFDFDGTLAFSNPDFNRRHDELKYLLYAEVLNVPLTPEVRTAYNELFAEYSTNSAVFKSLGLPGSYWMDKFEAADLAQYYQPRSDVPRVLSELALRANLGIFTNNKRATVERTLSRLNIPVKLFKHTLTGDEVMARKPDPEGFQKMLELADCKPNLLLFVGDRYSADIEPSQKLGAKGALVWGEDRRADYSFPEFTGLLAINN